MLMLCGCTHTTSTEKMAWFEANLGNPFYESLTLILLMCRIWWAHNNAGRWQVGFNSAFEGLRKGDSHIKHNSLTSTAPWLTPTRALSPSHTRQWPACGSLPSTTCFCTRTSHYPVTLIPIGSGYFRAKPFPINKYSKIFKPCHPSYLSAYEDGTDRVFWNVGI
jgi:hypothetical protein